jgi:hypothetical protein
MHLKSYSRKNNFFTFTTQGAPCVQTKIIILNPKVSLYFQNLRKILCLLIPMKSILWEQNLFGPLYSAWPKMFWPTMKRSLAQNTFFIYFVTFERYVTNLRTTFVLFPISTHPIKQYSIANVTIFYYRNLPFFCFRLKKKLN